MIKHRLIKKFAQGIDEQSGMQPDIGTPPPVQDVNQGMDSGGDTQMMPDASQGSDMAPAGSEVVQQDPAPEMAQPTPETPTMDVNQGTDMATTGSMVNNKIYKILNANGGYLKNWNENKIPSFYNK